jgi:hypothetical protein
MWIAHRATARKRYSGVTVQLHVRGFRLSPLTARAAAPPRAIDLVSELR